MIELKNIRKSYTMGSIKVEALRNVSLKIGSGEFVAIMGSSGSGKSTLLHLLGFLDRPDSGAYLLNGEDVSGFTSDQLANLRNSVAGFVFQQFHLLARMTALENVALPLTYAGKKELKEKAAEKIKAVGLADRARHRPNELSGGQQQRVAIARSLVNDPLIIFADEPTGNLDTKSEEEIIAILKELNREGKTIVMVTHEPEIAKAAKRIIHMRDGEIISDTWSGVDTANQDTITAKTVSVRESPKKTIFFVTEIIDNLHQGFRSILANKLRSFLSMLGILIGVAAVIAMLALGEGAKESIADRLSSLGTNILSVRSGARRMGGAVLEAGAVTRFTIKDAEAISKISGVRRVSPSVSGRGQVIYGNKNWNTRVQGTGTKFAEMRAYVPIAGRFFTEEELRSRQKVALVGLTVTKELFGKSNPIGETIKINRINFTVIGILPEKGSSGYGGDQDDIIIIPVTTAMYRLLGKEYVDSIDVEITDLPLMDTAKEEINSLILKRHRLKEEGTEDSFNIRNMAEIQEALQGMTKTMTMLLGFISAISLLVGGIGIMNIMLVSVTERTREIGLRKAIGAKERDIMLQFLIEAVVMTFSGGILGIIFGSGLALTLSFLAGWSTRVSLFSIILASGFSIAVGLGFGIWPARKAAQLNPIEALRYE